MTKAVTLAGAALFGLALGVLIQARAGEAHVGLLKPAQGTPTPHSTPPAPVRLITLCVEDEVWIRRALAVKWAEGKRFQVIQETRNGQQLVHFYIQEEGPDEVSGCVIQPTPTPVGHSTP